MVKIDNRKLIDLISVGPATIGDLKLLGITTVTQLKNKNAHNLYLKLNKIKGVKQDPCVEDVFASAIAQANNIKLSKEKCKWWYWSKIRKAKNK